MQGCPYDALYIDPQTETAAKCNFCAHKVEVGLEPPCVTVCPTQAIVAGDLDDPASRDLADGRAACPSRCASPRRGRGPRSSTSTATRPRWCPSAAPPAVRLHVGAARRRPRRCSRMPRRARPAAPRRTYGVKEQHRNSWGWKVSAYLWTKSLAAGAFLVPGAASRCSSPGATAAAAAPCSWPLVALAVTGVLLVVGPAPAEALPLDADAAAVALVADPRLVRHRRLRRCCSASHVLAALAARAVPRAGHRRSPSLLAAGTAVYTAFLFGQSKGRDLWQSPLLAPHLIVQALTAGAALFAPALAARGCCR